jgi:hypothetical protein
MPLMAFATTRKIDNGFAAMQRFVIVPLFLFGGAFYPISPTARVDTGDHQAAAAVARDRTGTRVHPRGHGRVDPHCSMLP